MIAVFNTNEGYGLFVERNVNQSIPANIAIWCIIKIASVRDKRPLSMCIHNVERTNIVWRHDEINEATGCSLSLIGINSNNMYEA